MRPNTAPCLIIRTDGGLPLGWLLYQHGLLLEAVVIWPVVRVQVRLSQGF